jgi:molybdopterin biosynthesis enzyme
LREDISAARDQPPFDRVAMDGIGGGSDAWRRGQLRLKLQRAQRRASVDRSRRFNPRHRNELWQRDSIFWVTTAVTRPRRKEMAD